MPSPGSAELRLGPFSGHWYGLLVALGAVVFCVVTALVARRRRGTGYDVFWICLAALPVRARRRAPLPPRDRRLGWAGRGGARDRRAAASGSSARRSAARWRSRSGARLRGLSALRLLDCRHAGARARAGDRPARQLVQPGALRRADRSLVGARDRSSSTARRTCSAHPRFQPTFAFEAIWDLGLAAILLWLLLRAPACAARGRARDVARRVRCRAVLDRGPAHRADASPRPAAPEPGRGARHGRRRGRGRRVVWSNERSDMSREQWAEVDRFISERADPVRSRPESLRSQANAAGGLPAIDVAPEPGQAARAARPHPGRERDPRARHARRLQHDLARASAAAGGPPRHARGRAPPRRGRRREHRPRGALGARRSARRACASRRCRS